MTYNLYDENGPEAKAGKKLADTLRKPMTDIAQKVGGTALTPARTLFNSTLKPAVVDPLVAGRVNQVRALGSSDLNANKTPAGDREAVGATLGPNFERKVGAVGQPFTQGQDALHPATTTSNPHGKTSNLLDPQPSPGSEMATTSQGPLGQPAQPLGLQRDGIQSQKIDQATQESFKRSLGQPVSTAAWAMEQNDQNPGPPMTTEYGQGQNGTFTKRQVPVVQRPTDPRSQLGLPQSKFNVGNMEVTFDPSVGQNARKAFLTDPVRPTAQIDRYNANVGNDIEQGRNAANNATRILGPNNNRESSGSGIGWQERKAYNLQAMQNEQTEKNARLSADTQLSTARISEGTAAERNAIDRTKVANDLLANTEQNATNRMNLTGMNAERGVNIEEKRFNLGERRAIADLQAKRDTATDPNEIRDIESRLEARGVLKRTPNMNSLDQNQKFGLLAKLREQYDFTEDANPKKNGFFSKDTPAVPFRDWLKKNRPEEFIAIYGSTSQNQLLSPGR